MDTVEQPGRAIGRDIARGESVEHEIDQFIQKRHADRVRDEGGRAEEEAWAANCRRHTEARRAENQSEWHLYHLDAADRLRTTLGALVSYHEQEAEKYLPKGSAA
ncbi:MAG: hypothetical protein H0U55_03050 [Rubrobacteraceae bacterium]|nr:hypothetical protein [Rubrobacteraceae bacterium]